MLHGKVLENATAGSSSVFIAQPSPPNKDPHSMGQLSSNGLVSQSVGHDVSLETDWVWSHGVVMGTQSRKPQNCYFLETYT